MASKVMLIRHGEKPSEDGTILGVDMRGNTDENELSVSGWQRAGALVRLFAPAHGAAHRDGLATPGALFAPATAGAVKSKRSKHTLLPLAKLLSIPIRTDIEKGDEEALAEAVRATPGVVLVCWAHQGLPAIARALHDGEQVVPSRWPEERFDLVWIVDLVGSPSRFSQAAQLVLAGDLPVP